MRSFRITFLFLSLAGFLLGCTRERYVAEVLDKKISDSQFRERYEQYLAQFSKRDNIALRTQILNNMINEILIFDDLRRLGLDSDEAARARNEQITKQALLDAYARRMTVDTMTITEAELWNEFRAFNTKVNARFVYAQTEQGAMELKRKLIAGVTFEDLATEAFEDPGLANNGGNLGWFGWGDMEPALEEQTFSVPVGQLSDPVRLKMGYAIVRVESRTELPLASEYDYAKQKEKLSRTIRQKKVVRLLQNATQEISKGLNPKFNDAAVHVVFRNRETISRRTPRKWMEGPDTPLSQLSSATTLVDFNGGAWTVANFLDRLESTSERQRMRVKTLEDVKDIAIGLATRDLLLERALKEGLRDDSDVKFQIEKVRTEYLLKRWAGIVRDTVGQNDPDPQMLRRYYEVKREEYVFPPEVNVAEILVRTAPEARAIMKELDRGAAFADLARSKSIRLWAAKRGGELGFGTRSTFGILGEKFFAAEVGERIGPERVDPYVGVYKVIGRQEGRQKSFEEAEPQISNEIAFVRKREVFKNAIETLRKRAQIIMNMDVLANIVVQGQRQ